MTVCGFVVTDQRTAFAWSDSETYLDGEPSGHVSKMAVNPLTGVVGVGAGIHVALIEAAGTMRLATGLDQVAALLPFTLCRVMEPKYWEARGLAALSADEGGSYGVVGWSAKFGRIVGYRFRTATRFAPELVHSFGSPHVAQILGLVSYAMEPADLVDAAIAQLEVVRGGHSGRFRRCPDDCRNPGGRRDGAASLRLRDRPVSRPTAGPGYPLMSRSRTREIRQFVSAGNNREARGRPFSSRAAGKSSSSRIGANA
ncbi:MAG: hypothetical protein WDN69_30755 [Aliidongia sp.]